MEIYKDLQITIYFKNNLYFIRIFLLKQSRYFWTSPRTVIVVKIYSYYIHDIFNDIPNEFDFEFEHQSDLAVQASRDLIRNEYELVCKRRSPFKLCK